MDIGLLGSTAPLEGEATCPAPGRDKRYFRAYWVKSNQHCSTKELYLMHPRLARSHAFPLWGQ